MSQNQAAIDPETGDIIREGDGRRPDRHGLRDEDDDEAEARAEFIHRFIMHRDFGPLLEVMDKEPDVRLAVIRKADGSRDIRVSIGARRRSQVCFNLMVAMSQSSAEDGDSNAFASADFLAHLPEFDSLRWAIDRTSRDIESLCIAWDSLGPGRASDREELKQRIIGLHDKRQRLRQARARWNQDRLRQWLGDAALEQCGAGA